MNSAQLLIVLEQWPSFGEASARLKVLTAAHGSGALIRRSTAGFALLASPAYVLRLSPPSPEFNHLTATRKGTRVLRAPRATGGTRPCQGDAPLPVLVPGAETPLRPAKKPLDRLSVTSTERPRTHLARGKGAPLPVSSVATSSRRTTAIPPEGRPTRIGRGRASALVEQLIQAFRAAPASLVQELLSEVAKCFGAALARRVGNVIDLSIFILGKAGSETVEGGRAFLEGHGIEHLASRGGKVKMAALRTAHQATTASVQLLADVRAKPREFVPRLMVASLAFYAGSGGLDGDGGLADSDLELFGIGGHRSIFTHSIVAGAAAETALVGLVLFVRKAHAYLPQRHDPLWDVILARSHTFGEDARQATSAGLAFHLGVDTFIEPANYVDLPFSTTEEVHHVISGGNSVAEASAVGRKPCAANFTSRDREKTAIGVAGAAPSVKDVAVGGALAVAAWILGFA